MREQAVRELEATLEALQRAFTSWGEALTPLQVFVTYPLAAAMPHVDGLAGLMTEIMQQRLRLSALIGEVEREQLACYSTEKGGEMAALPH